MSEHVIRIVPDENKISSAYILAFLKTDYAQQELAKGVFGSVIDEITPEHIGKIIIPIPKDKTKLQDIVNKIMEAETSREIAIKSANSAVQLLNSLF